MGLSVSDLKTLLGMSQDQRVGLAMINRDMADQILEETNSHNRKISMTQVAKIRGQLERGEFFLSTDCLGFDDNGVLMNGQHRLSALSSLSEEYADKTYPFGVMFGVRQELDQDTGRKRSLKDNAMLSEKYDIRLKEGSRVASLQVVQILCKFIRGEGWSTRKGGYTQQQYANITNFFADKLVECSDMGMFRKVKGVPPASYAAFFCAYLCGVDPKHMLKILDVIEKHEFTDEPVIYAFKERISQEVGGDLSAQKTRYCMTQYCIHALEEGITTKRMMCNKFWYTYDGCDEIG